MTTAQQSARPAAERTGEGQAVSAAEAGVRDRRAGRRPGFAQVLRHREFRAIWLADAQSSLGDQLTRIALAVLIYDRSHSALVTALVYAVTFLPAMFGGVLFGGLADRLPHRSVLIHANLGRAAIVAAMTLPQAPTGLLVVLVVLSAALAAPFDSANSAMLADVLHGEEFTVGAALRGISHQLAQLLGFAAGGLILTAVSPRTAIGIDALTFLVAAALVAAAVTRRPAPASSAGLSESYLDGLRGGVRVVRDSPRLRLLLALSWLMGLFVIPEGLAAPYAAQIHADSRGLGLLMAAAPAGTAAGSFLFMKLLPEGRRLRLLPALAAAGGLPLIACAAHPSLPLSCLLWLLAGACCAYLAQLMPTYVASTPPHRRGQAIGLAASGLLAVQGLGVLLGGAVATHVAPSTAIAGGGLAACCLAAALHRSWQRAFPAAAR